MALGGFHCLVFMSVLLILSSCGMADKAQDRQECTNQLVGLATCLPYVSGTAKAPTPDCCNGLKQVLKNDKKCLCVIIRDRNDPDLGLNINVTLALGLPSVCHASANVSQCPELLHMDPNSPEAKVFYQFGRSSDQGAPASSPSPAPASGGSSTGANASSGSSRKGCCSGKRWLGLEMISCGILLWYFIGSSYLFV